MNRVDHPLASVPTSSGPAEASFVSGRFLSDFFGALERRGVPARQLLGDLPIRLGEKGDVLGDVDWSHFADFMRRLDLHVGGANGIEGCGELMSELAPAAALQSLAGLAASPVALYQAATNWALRRALPGIEARIHVVDAGHLEIRARLADGLRPCPEIFHFATGGARVLPRLIGLGDAVVSAEITPHSANYRIIVPPSLTLLARVKRLLRTTFSAGSVLHYLEVQQLELHAKNDSLQRAHDALAESERRYRAIADTAVDVLCEIDENGRIVYVSPSIQDLIGYDPEQVTGSHYRLWVPRESHSRVSQGFQSLATMPEGTATQDTLKLHAEHGEPVVVELTARAYDTPEGARRLVCILRDLSVRTPTRQTGPTTSANRPKIDKAKANTPTRIESLNDTILFTPESEQKQWVETRKLMRSARDMFLASPRALGFEVDIDLTRVPAEIWTHESQLLIAIVHLLDWAAEGLDRAAEKSSAPRTLSLGAGQMDEAGGPLSVFIEVSAGRDPRATGTESKRTRLDQAESSFASSSTLSLTLSLAEEAVGALGGRLLCVDGTGETADRSRGARLRRASRRITLPQPQNP